MTNILPMFFWRSMQRYATVWASPSQSLSLIVLLVRNWLLGYRSVTIVLSHLFNLPVVLIVDGWFEFITSCWTHSFNSIGFQGSHHHTWDGCVSWLSWAVWCTINRCGNIYCLRHIFWNKYFAVQILQFPVFSMGVNIYCWRAVYTLNQNLFPLETVLIY